MSVNRRAESARGARTGRPSACPRLAVAQAESEFKDAVGVEIATVVALGLEASVSAASGLAASLLAASALVASALAAYRWFWGLVVAGSMVLWQLVV